MALKSIPDYQNYKIMKSIFVLFFTAMLTFCQAQNESIERFYSKYTKLENVTEINISGNLLNLVATYSDENSEGKVLEKISKLRILAIDDQHIVETSDKKAMLSGLRKNHFEELMQIRDGKSRIDFMIREKGNKITNILMLVDDEDSFFLLSLEGNITWKDIEKLNIDIDGAEHLKKMPRA